MPYTILAERLEIVLIKMDGGEFLHNIEKVKGLIASFFRDTTAASERVGDARQHGCNVGHRCSVVWMCFPAVFNDAPDRSTYFSAHTWHGWAERTGIFNGDSDHHYCLAQALEGRLLGNHLRYVS